MVCLFFIKFITNIKSIILSFIIMSIPTMNNYICNKCYSTRSRKSKSFKITQCGHIFCNDCLDEGTRSCPRCSHGDVVSLELKEPLLPKVASLFIPLNEAIQPLIEVVTFQSMQTQIVQRRFHEIDKKYSLLKEEYRKLIHNMQMVTDKYNKLRELTKVNNRRLGYSTSGTSNTPSNCNHRKGYINTARISVNSSIPTLKTHGNIVKFTPSTNQSIYERLRQATINSKPKTSYETYSINNHQQ